MALTDELIALYASYARQDAATRPNPETQPDYLALHAKYGKDPAFIALRAQLAKWLGILGDVPGYGKQQQIIKCLHTLRRISADRSAFLAFVRVAFAAGWDDAQRAYFERCALLFSEGYDYFLSFTGRNPRKAVAVLRANREYMSFISQVLTPDRVRDARLDDENLLAEALNALLRTDHQCQGFFYLDRKGDSTVVRDKLGGACKLSLCFVQLVENEMFTVDQEIDSNYCHWEYERAIEHALLRYFLFASDDRADLIAEADTPIEFNGWYAEVSAKDLRMLPRSPAGVQSAAAKIQAEIAALAKQIKRARDAAIEGVPP